MGKEKIFFDKMFCSGQYNLEINFQIQNTNTILKFIFNFEVRYNIQS